MELVFFIYGLAFFLLGFDHNIHERFAQSHGSHAGHDAGIDIDCCRPCLGSGQIV